jgi:hypothetical protein
VVVFLVGGWGVVLFGVLVFANVGFVLHFQLPDDSSEGVLFFFPQNLTFSIRARRTLLLPRSLGLELFWRDYQGSRLRAILIVHAESGHIKALVGVAFLFVGRCFVCRLGDFLQET